MLASSAEKISNHLEILQLHRENKTKGFTLLELIVVCALIGIMLTISVPSLRSSFFTNPLKSSARQVIGIVNEARQKAVRSHQAYYIHLSQIDNHISYEKVSEANNDKEETETETDDNKKRDLQLPATVRLASIWLQSSGITSENKTSFWISKKGYMEQAAIQLSDESGDSLSVRINPFTDPIAVSEDFPPNS